MTQKIRPNRLPTENPFHRAAVSVVRYTAEGVFVANRNNIIQSVNPAFSKITGYSTKEAVGQTPRLLRSGHHDKAFYAKLWQSLHEQGIWQGEILNRRKNGEIYPQRTVINTVYGDDCHVMEYVCIFSDNTEQKCREEQLKFMALHDQLTKLPNRTLLNERLKFALEHAQRNKEKLAVIFIDLDGFKAVNDQQGHEMGDILLRSIAVRLSASVRASDTAARFGGDEFVLILMNVKHDKEIGKVADRILQNIAKPIVFEQQTLQVRASLGISFFPENGETAPELIRAADSAMYAAKRHGHSYAFYGEQAGERNCNFRR